MALAALVDDPVVAAAVLAAHAVPALVQALRTALRSTEAMGADGNPLSRPVFRHMASGLSSLPHVNGGAAAVLEAGALPVLLDALRSADCQIKRAAAQVLANLGHRAGVRQQLVPAVQLLVSCLSQADLLLQATAAVALGNMADSPATQAAVLSAGGIPRLLACMESGSEDVAAAAAQAIGNVCSGSDTACSRAVTEGGGVQLAVQCMLRARGELLMEKSVCPSQPVCGHPAPCEAPGARCARRQRWRSRRAAGAAELA